jgi:DNA-binding HxlR family transcriptional regulator
MRRKPLDRMDCSIAKALDIVGDPWTMLILRDALLGVKRFETFSTRLGIPRATLSARLDHLCERGVLEQRRYQDRPERVEYVLTAKGRALRPVVVTLMQWGDQWVRDDDPPTTIVDTDTGAVVDPVLVDRSSGTPLDDLRLRAQGGVTTGLDRSTDAAL